MSEYLRKYEFNKNKEKNNNDTDLADECKTIYDIPEDEETLTPSYYGTEDEEDEEYLYNEFLNNEFEENKEIFEYFYKKTIVKKLDSIQNFGAMNILCTDKTGTLTEDKIVLERYLDINGDEDIRILKHAFLNSYFQTGLKGSIDEAVIKRASENNLMELTEKYKIIDEIPFDFSRRRLSVIVSDGV